jgi:tetratricopeptide (TPR) repeat protein
MNGLSEVERISHNLTVEGIYGYPFPRWYGQPWSRIFRSGIAQKCIAGPGDERSAVIRPIAPMKIAHWLFVCLTLAGCGSLGSQSDFQSGRQALLRGEPETALTYFERVTASNAGYSVYSGPLRESVWTYVGRAHYNSGRYTQARTAFDRALAQFNDEHVARLYRGLTLIRPAPPPAPPTRNPFSLQEVTFALKEGVESRRVATLARERGVGFDLNRETEAQLRNIGAENSLLDEIRTIRAAAARTKTSDEQLSQAAADLRAALTGLNEWLNYIKANSIEGRFWDPGGEIRAKLQEGLSLLSPRAPNWDAVLANGEWLGYQLIEEVDRARRDEQRERQRRRG